MKIWFLPLLIVYYGKYKRENTMEKNYIFKHQISRSASTWAEEDFYINPHDFAAKGALFQLRMFIDSYWHDFRCDRECSRATAFIGLILSGEQLRGENMLYPGDVVVENNRSQPLVSKAVNGKELHRLVIILARTPALDLLLPTLFPENTALIRQGGTPEVREIFTRIRESVSGNGNEKEISLLIFRLLQELSAVKQENYLHPALEKALEFIRRRGYGGISREEIARAAGVSNRQLNILFQKFLNTSPGAFLIRRRINFAKELLAAGKLPVNEIARMSGFTSTEFFIRAFRKYTGVTPGKWDHRLQ